MARLVAALGATVAAVVLLLGYRTSTPHPPGSTATRAVAAAGATSGGQVWTGRVASTRWGPVQVQITVVAGRVTRSTAVQVPDGNHRDAEINGYAVPVLDAEAVAAQSAQIDAVSGATITSDGYVTSLQSALDAAGL